MSDFAGRVGWFECAVALIIVSIVGRLYMALSSTPTSVSSALHDLRDAGAKRFVAYVNRRLMVEASKGRSDFEFHFRSFDVFLEWRPVLFFVIPMPTTYWDCIDSSGSRDVVKAMLEGGNSKLRVDWSIHIDYPKKMAPKWVLTCKWDREELTRKTQFGGR